MKSFISKHEGIVCAVLISSYLIINSLCLQLFGAAHYLTALINTLYSAVLLFIVLKVSRREYYGLCPIKGWQSCLYFLPLVMIATTNLWAGINVDGSFSEVLCHIITMLNVGFIEELIFRGFLFRLMAKDNVRTAVIVTGLTFGMGHIINLLSGAQITETLLQVVYASAVGILFSVIFYSTGSLIPCIITHCAVNSLSVLAAEKEELLWARGLFTTVIALVYAFYIVKKTKKPGLIL